MCTADATILFPCSGRDMLAVSDLGEFERYDVGPRRTPAQFFDWAGVDIQNNWGPGTLTDVR